MEVMDQITAPGLGELPAGWTWKTLGEIADVIGGGTPKTNDSSNYEGGKIPWITPADLSGYSAKYIGRGERYITEKGLKDSSARMMPAGTVLFSSRAPVGYVAIASNPVCTNQGFKSFVLKNGDVLPDYIYWWLKGNKDLAESMASGTTFLELSGAKAKQLPIPIAPISEQKLIVAEIEKQFSRLDEAVANLKRVKANLKRYKAAVLKAAVEGRLVETEAELARREGRKYETGVQHLQRILEARCSQWKGKGKYKEPFAPDTTDLPELPEGWVWTSFDSLIANGPQNGIYLPKSLYGSGHPILRIDDFQQDWIRPVTALQRVRAKPADVAMYSLRKDDLVINRVNSPSHLGKVAVWATETEMPMFESNMMRVALSKNVAPLYVAAYFRSLHGRARLTKQAKWAVNQASINQQDVCTTEVPLPPFAEQQRIVAEVDRRLSLIREVAAQVDTNFKRAERLRQTILSSAFSGRLVWQVVNPPEDRPLLPPKIDK